MAAPPIDLGVLASTGIVLPIVWLGVYPTPLMRLTAGAASQVIAAVAPSLTVPVEAVARNAPLMER